MLTSKPPPPEKLLMLMLPGKLNTTDKRDSHSIPLLRPGLLTCQTMLLKMMISTSKPQLQLRKFWLMPKRLKLRPRKPLPQLKRQPPPQQPQKPLHHSSNFTEAETSYKRELPQEEMRNHLNLNQDHQEPAHHHHQLTNERINFEEKIIVF